MGNGSGKTLAGLSVLVVEDEALLRRRLIAHLKELGAEAAGAETLEAARRKVEDAAFDFMLLDIHLPDGEGLALLREGLVPAGTGVVVMTAQGAVEGAVESMRLGALDYLVKPFDPALLSLVMHRARTLQQTSRAAEHERDEEDQSGFFFGNALAPLRDQLEKILAADNRLKEHLSPVLITGETGTGKSTLARWVHRNGPRAGGPMIEVNCSALPETLAESELFGSEKGAYTDARATRQGLFEAAHGGTLFLDELPSLSSAIQAKVLTAIEDGGIRRIGGTRQIEVDVRIIAATNRNMHEAVDSGDFREDLLHRLDLFRLDLLPLYERGEDLLVLANRLLGQLCRRHRLPMRRITEEGRRRMLAYRWPGNVRELAHELERGLVFEESAALDFAHLPMSGTRSAQLSADPDDWLNPMYDFSKEEFVLEDAVSRLVQIALKLSDGNMTGAARMLGVTRDFIRYRLYGDRKEKG